ncbi:phosphate signaling complex protein PhoU [Pseudonocardia sp. C8]|uniref:phosphate signaling complex protein PhoU n=1 Tax=Pseudonocardia sp. C8 TaxID=2762759 RepID=UPI0016429196|nr:phosphate signaling complex protein PhoU [Pseudonocardia sp. C8]
MRQLFHGDLEQLGRGLASMCGQAADALDDASGALLDTDLARAERVIGNDSTLDTSRARWAEHAERLLALQAPVARDLRRVVTGIQIADKIERMGDLARHVAEVARRRHPERAVPDPLVEPFREMCRLAVGLARNVQQTITSPEQARPEQRERDDDRIDQLHHTLLAGLDDLTGPHPVRTAIDVALLARFVERFADQAVAISRRLDYIHTGAPH